MKSLFCTIALAAAVVLSGCTTVKTAGPALGDCAKAEVQKLLPGAEAALEAVATTAVDHGDVVGQLDAQMRVIASQAIEDGPTLAECALDALEATTAKSKGDQPPDGGVATTAPPATVLQRIQAYRAARARSPLVLRGAVTP